MIESGLEYQLLQHKIEINIFGEERTKSKHFYVNRVFIKTLIECKNRKHFCFFVNSSVCFNISILIHIFIVLCYDSLCFDASESFM